MSAAFVMVRRRHDDEPERFDFETLEAAYVWAEYMDECGFICDVRRVKGSAEAAAREAGPGEH